MADGPFIRPDRDPTGAPTMPAGGRGAAEPRLPEPESPDQLPGEARREQLPPDPEAYDSERAKHARARGLSAPYIAGGTDPNPEQGRREERRFGILLIAMIVIVVFAGFVLGIVQNLLGL